MQPDRLKRLLAQYFNDSISSADCIELLRYLDSADPAELDGSIDVELPSLDDGPAFKGVQSQEVLNRIKSDTRFKHTHAVAIKFYQRRIVQIAATILIFLGAGLIFFNIRKTKTTNDIANNNKSSKIVPGGNKATLTVSGGKTILLDSAANGLLATTSAGEVIKTQNGQIAYKGALHSAELTNATVEWNTLATPRGGEYQLVLPDGTKVWLDAASSISYPVAFTGNSRRVRLTGQGYFEVAKNKEKPFYVDVNHAEVRVLGTHFNISAYEEDPENTTTLLEGSVQIAKNGKVALLKPGQQASIAGASDNIVVSEANIDDVMAWKNGYFIFNDDDIRAIMRKVSRWYNVDVDYQGDFGSRHFGGTYYRSKGINELLNHLERIGKLHFKVAGRRVTVMD